MRVAVVKSGGAWYGFNSGKKVSPLVNQRNHWAIAKLLEDAGHDVLCCGRIYGDTQVGEQVGWEVPGRKTVSEMKLCIMDFVEQVGAWQPDICVNIVGSSMTVSSPDNPRGVIPLDTGVRGCWPMFVMLQELQLPRICIITDMRTYPVEQEMLWNQWARPVALLSQENRQYKRKIIHNKYECKAVYAGFESLRVKWTERKRSTREIQAVVLAHAHMKDPRIRKNRQEVWNWIMWNDELRSILEVRGCGWEEYNWYNDEMMPGPLDPNDVNAFLNTATCGPLVAMADNWVSPKYREMAVMGCLPFPYGRGQETYTYDKQAHIIPLDHDTRFQNSNELLQLVRRANEDLQWYNDKLDEAMALSEPNPQVLLDCVDHFGSLLPEDFDRFGGYRKLES